MRCVRVATFLTRSLSASGADNFRVSTLAGSGSVAFANGVGAAAAFNGPRGAAIDASGVAYITDKGNHRVRQLVLSTGAVTTLVGSGAATSTDGTGTSATMYNPMYAALDGVGNLYVSDYSGGRIRKVVLATQVVTTAAGTGSHGFADGVGVAAAFNGPLGIVCDARGHAYVADHSNHRIRKMVLSSATVTTLAGSGTPSAANGVGGAAGFNYPTMLALDSSGTLLFVADYTNSMIRQIVIATQTVTTLAGSGTSGSANGVGTVAQFNAPDSIAIDSSGNLYVGESHRVRLIVIATRMVTTLAGTSSLSWVDGFGTNARFNSPTGLVADTRGNVIVLDHNNHRIRMLQPTVPCPAGVYCAPGAEAVACTPGYYCAAGADRALCSQGFYCPSGSSAQVACPAGAFHCPAGTTAPMSIACAAGYDSSASYL